MTIIQPFDGVAGVVRRHLAAHPRTVTRLLGGLYLLGAAGHVAIWSLAPDSYEGFADQALVGAYTDVWIRLIVPHRRLLVPLVAVFEAAVGIALLRGGTGARLGHGLAGLFQATLVLSGPWGPINAALAMVHGLGARSERSRPPAETASE